MISSEQRIHIDKIWNRFKPVSSFKPFAVIELIAYMLYLKRLDEIQTLKEIHPILAGEPMVNPIFTQEETELRWNQFRNLAPQQLYQLFTKENGVFEFGKKALRPASTFSRLLNSMDVMFPTSGMLADLVEMISGLEIKDRLQTAAIFDYLLTKPEAAGENNQFSTPKQITRLMVELMEPQPTDTICDPALGTGGCMVQAAQYIQKNFPDSYLESEFNCYFPPGTFTGFDSDETMLRIAAMNLLIHGIEDPELHGINALGKLNQRFAAQFSLILSVPPFTGNMDINEGDAAILKEIKSRKANLRYLALISKGLKNDGRAAVIVPQELLYGATSAHLQVRKSILDNQSLKAIISLPERTFHPYSDLPSALVVFSNSVSAADHPIWFYKMESDGTDRKEAETYSDQENSVGWQQTAGDIPHLLEQWRLYRNNGTLELSEKSFLISAAEMRSANYDWSPEAYKKLIREKIRQRTKPIEKKPERKRNLQNAGEPDPHSSYEPYPESSGRWKQVLGFILLILLIAAGVFGYYYYVERPQMQMVSSDSIPDPGDSAHSGSPDLSFEDTGSDTSFAISQPPPSPAAVEPKPAISIVQEPPEEKPAPDTLARKETSKQLVKKPLGKYKVITRAYFHDRPDEEQIRLEDFVVNWDNAYTTLQALEERRGFVYVVFTNSEGRIIKGWLKKEDLRPAEEE